MMVPTAASLAVAGMASVGLFAFWKLKVAPRLAPRDSQSSA